MMHQASVHDGKAWRQGLALWFLLLSIFTHAIVPTGSPLQRTSGSAFSATTVEVAIVPKRKAVGTKQAEVSGGHEGSLEGAGAGDHPPAILVTQGVPTAGTAEPATPITGQARAPDGGAAPFSARAPPSI